MKICFNQGTSMKYSTLERDLELSVQYGYDMIELRFDKLHDYLRRHKPESLKKFFDENPIGAYAFDGLISPNLREGAPLDDIYEELELFCEIGRMIGCDKTVVVPALHGGKFTEAEIKEDMTEVLNKLADFAEPKGMKLALEFLGYPNCSVNTYNQAMDIVAAVNRDSVGVVLDCFHFFSMGSRIEDIRARELPNVFVFHIDDGEDSVVGTILNDDTRLFPGDGVYPLVDVVRLLEEKGYDDVASVELFRPEYYEMDIEELFRVSKEKTLNVLVGI
jgi:2-keto-myo-inositol isomerase